ncbi:MAG: hypothetical protein FWG32_05735 [Oscillospiraceae bacterium]|nr:hypothetical protein [Oscillospiraceae bacterium]
MSIKGIDAQMMIARVPDFVRETSTQLKVGDLMQEYLAVQNKIMEDREKSMVTKTNSPHHTELRLENESDGTGSYYESSENRERENSSQQSVLDEEIGVNEHIIDIRL